MGVKSTKAVPSHIIASLNIITMTFVTSNADHPITYCLDEVATEHR